MAASAPSALAGRRILVAEDNTFIQLVVRTALVGAGAAVVMVDDGAAALAAFDAEGPFDVVLLDVQMPGMDGLEAARALRQRERGRAVRIVALTANVAPEDQARCRAAGMDVVLGKPILPDVLVALLAE